VKFNLITGWHPVRVRLKGLHFVPKKLADGRVREYVYAWRGGPRILGQPGSPEFLASYNEAILRRAAPQVGTMRSVLAAYEADVEAFGGLADPLTKSGASPFPSARPTSSTDTLGRHAVTVRECQLETWIVGAAARVGRQIADIPSTRYMVR
jgi:hypothetical protein